MNFPCPTVVTESDIPCSQRWHGKWTKRAKPPNLGQGNPDAYLDPASAARNLPDVVGVALLPAPHHGLALKASHHIFLRIPQNLHSLNLVINYLALIFNVMRVILTYFYNLFY